MVKNKNNRPKSPQHFNLKNREKKKKKDAVFDFIDVRGQQTLKMKENAINPIEIKTENDKIQNMLEKYKQYQTRFNLEGRLFSSLMINDMEIIFVTTSGLFDAKYSLVNGKLYQTIEVINLNEIEN